MMRYPLIAPNPPRLSEHIDALERIERSGIYSNNGPELRAFEAEMTQRLFGGMGASLGVANATLGLMLAIRHAAGNTPGGLALVPALTFAATAQAAEWAGLTPLIADIDPETWMLCPAAVERLLRRHGERIKVIIPYAAFGAALDLEHYARLSEQYDVGVVVDAASSLGTIDDAGHGFGTGARCAIVYSMHATKTFAVGEAGLVYSGDADLIATLRAMAGFGFEAPRSASLPGLNAKMSELTALMGRLKLAEIDGVCEHRATIEAAYREALGGFALQRAPGRRHAMQFMPVLLPSDLARRRDDVTAALEARGIGVGRYFSPHLGEQPWFRDHALIEPTPVADDVGARMLSLPVTDVMEAADATHIAETLRTVCSRLSRRTPARAAPVIADALLVGGGPAGTALLTAAAKAGHLGALARGLVVVERDHALGGGRIGEYAINSDSTAHTFLTAVEGNAEPSLAALTAHPAARMVARHRDALGVPLPEVAPLLRATGDRLAATLRSNGGQVLTGHEAVGARRTPEGLWRVHLRREDGHESEQLTRALVIATGGHQPIERLATQRVGGERLVTLAGTRLLQSDRVLTRGGLEEVIDLLGDKRDPRIAVLGGSTSALATVVALLKRGGLPLGAGAITLIHRRPLRPFYPSAEAALADGFTDWTAEDICPVSGFIYRLAGFRLEARELVLRMLEIGGRRSDPRVVCHRLSPLTDPTAQALVRDADLVIAALGYRPRGLPLTDASGATIALASDKGGAMVDRQCRVMGGDGLPLPAVFGIGLAAGFVPWGRMGGEPSFLGQANGLWQWQNDVGAMILGQLLDSAVQPVRAAA